MISRATSAKATTSVRRITGGNSPLLSGSGAPCASFASLRSRGDGFAGGDLAAEGLMGAGLAGTGLVGVTLTGYPPPEAAMTRQKPYRRRAELWRPNAVGRDKFHRGSVSADV